MKKADAAHLSEFLDRASTAERQRYLNARLKELIGYAYRMAPTIRARLDKAGIVPSAISNIEDLESLPILRKDELVDLYKAHPPLGGLVTVPMQKLERVYISPGPIYDPHHGKKFWERHIYVVRALGFGKKDVVVNTWSYHLVPAGLIWDEALRRAGATVIPTGVGNTELQVEVMRHLKVTGFLGTTGFFMNIINKAEEMGYDIRKDFNLRLVCIGGEMGGGPIRTTVEQKYGIATRDVYGIADCGIIAYECPSKTGMHIADDLIVEIVNPETGRQVVAGEIGEIVVTPIDEIYPLIRFGTGDLATISYEACPCGRTSPRLSRILGRVGDAVRTRGMFIHPRQLEQALSSFLGISRYQAVVTRVGYRDELALKVELKSEEGVEKQRLTKELGMAVQAAIRIKLDRVEFVSVGTIPEVHNLLVDERVY